MTCSAEDGTCDGQVVARGWCRKHYERWRRHGDTVKQYPWTNREVKRYLCEVCGSAASRGATYCRSCWSDTPREGNNSPSWVGEHATYHTAHKRIKNELGRASQNACVDCGNQAKHWAYMGGDPNEKYGPRPGGWSFYSLNPMFYLPMCARCHSRRDKSDAARQLKEYRQILHETKLSPEEIREICLRTVLQS